MKYGLDKILQVVFLKECARFLAQPRSTGALILKRSCLNCSGIHTLHHTKIRLMRLLPLLGLFLFAATGYTCTCAYPSFEEQVSESTAIFSGKVIKIEPAGNNQLGVELEIIKNYKGPAEKKFTIRTAESDAACGYSFQLKEAYLVFATGKESFEVSLCSRTMFLKEASQDLSRLAKTDDKQPERDPFVEMKGETVNNRKENVPKALNIANAVLVGITKKPEGYVALVRATNNQVYFLKVGDKLHDGVVLRIDAKAVTFRQYKGYRSVLVRKELRPFPD